MDWELPERALRMAGKGEKAFPAARRGGAIARGGAFLFFRDANLRGAF